MTSAPATLVLLRSDNEVITVSRPMSQNVASEKTLQSNQVIAIQKLLTTGSTAKAARAARVDVRTVQRWLRDDEEFRLALAQAEVEALKSAAAALAAGAADAVSTVRAVMNNTKNPPGVRLRAAVSWLEIVSRFRNDVLIEERLTRLENLLNAKPNQKTS